MLDTTEEKKGKLSLFTTYGKVLELERRVTEIEEWMENDEEDGSTDESISSDIEERVEALERGMDEWEEWDDSEELEAMRNRIATLENWKNWCDSIEDPDLNAMEERITKLEEESNDEGIRKLWDEFESEKKAEKKRILAFFSSLLLMALWIILSIFPLRKKEAIPSGWVEFTTPAHPVWLEALFKAEEGSIIVNIDGEQKGKTILFPGDETYSVTQRKRISVKAEGTSILYYGDDVLYGGYRWY